jgi:hypothetical protein
MKMALISCLLIMEATASFGQTPSPCDPGLDNVQSCPKKYMPTPVAPGAVTKETKQRILDAIADAKAKADMLQRGDGDQEDKLRIYDLMIHHPEIFLKDKNEIRADLMLNANQKRWVDEMEKLRETAPEQAVEAFLAQGRVTKPLVDAKNAAFQSAIKMTVDAYGLTPDVAKAFANSGLGAVPQQVPARWGPGFSEKEIARSPRSPDSPCHGSVADLRDGHRPPFAEH